MAGKPEDISQEAWDAAGQVMMLSMRKARHMAEPMNPTEFIARAIMAATAAERQFISNALNAAKYLPSQGMDGEMEAFNDGIDECVSIVRNRGEA